MQKNNLQEKKVIKIFYFETQKNKLPKINPNQASPF